MIVKMMSICLTRVPISGLGIPKLYQNMWCFTRIGYFTWRVSDGEELMRVTHMRSFFSFSSINFSRFLDLIFLTIKSKFLSVCDNSSCFLICSFESNMLWIITPITRFMMIRPLMTIKEMKKIMLKLGIREGEVHFSGVLS